MFVENLYLFAQRVKFSLIYSGGSKLFNRAITIAQCIYQNIIIVRIKKIIEHKDKEEGKSKFLYLEK